MVDLLTKLDELEKENKELREINHALRDVTQTQAISKELERANEFLIEAQSLANIGHWEWEIGSGEIQWSDQIFRIFGFEPQSFTPTYPFFLNTIREEERDEVSNAVNVALETKTIYDVQHRIVLPDGSEKMVHEIGHAAYADDGSAIRMIGTVQDITKIHSIEKDLKEQKEAFETIFEYAYDGMSLFKNGKIVSCNSALVDMLRATSKEDILATDLSQLSPEYQERDELSSDKVTRMIEICTQSGHNQFEWLYKRFDGEVFWADITLTCLTINNEKIIHASWRDISDRKTLENALLSSKDKYKTLANELDHRVKEQSAQLIKQSKMAQMGELLSMIAHQWRQPLSTIAAVAINIQMRVGLFNVEKADRESFEELTAFVNMELKEINKYTQSLSHTIDDFKNLYKSGTNLMDYSVTKPIDDALDLIQISLTTEKIKIEKFYHTQEKVHIQNSEIMQVIVNILKNAQDNFKEKKIENPIISITTTQMKDIVRVSIDDNGGGIDEGVLESIFNPYFSTKDEKNGTGLGLYMCKLIIERSHKGRISAKNTSIGASFLIELPKISS